MPKAAAIPLPPRRVFLIATVVVVALLVLWKCGVDLEWLHDHVEKMNAGAILLALATLPLVGFPASVLHAAVGARFGLPLGMGFVGLSIALHLAASYGIVRAAPAFFARRFGWLRERLPPATHRSLALFTLVLPGAPYFAQNYVLALAGVPFRIFFAYALPIHFARSLIGLIFGEWSGDMTPLRGAVFVAYALTVTLACGLSFRRLRAQLRNRPPAAGGRKRRA